MRSKRHSYEFIKEEFKRKGLTLLSNEYHNTKEKLEFLCNEGHYGRISFDKMYYRKQGCSECSKRKRRSFEEVKELFEKKDWKLLTTEYINNTTKLEYICNKGHRGSTTLKSFMLSSVCLECCGNKKKTIDEIKVLFESSGYRLISDKYFGKDTPLKFICNKGHTGEIRFSDFRKGHRCIECSGKKTKTIEEIEKSFLDIGWKLLTTRYINNSQKLDYLCDKGHRWRISWNNFKAGWGCPFCSVGSVSKISQQWLDEVGISKEFREIRITLSDGTCVIVDGFDPKTNTIYEFLGDFWHGNPEKFPSDEINPVSKKTFGQLYKETFERFRSMESLDYKMVYIWESDFNKQQMDF